MSDPINHYPSDWPGDVEAGGEGFNPTQNAMHGLLSAYFEAESSDRSERADAILARLGIQPTGAAARASCRPAAVRQHLYHKLRRLALPVLLLAGVTLTIAVFWRSTPPLMAKSYANAANAGTVALYFAGDLSTLFNDDPAQAEQHRKIINDEKLKVQEELAAPVQDTGLLFAWQALYCDLRDLGLREESIRENEAALAYIRSAPEDQRSMVWEAILLDGLGNTLAAFGDYQEARTAYLESLAIRWIQPGNPDDPHHGEPGYEGDIVGAVTFLYCRLVMLSLAEGDLPQAWRWHNRAEAAVQQWLRTTCEANGVAVATDATLWELWNALPAEYRHPKMTTSSDEESNSPSAAYRLYLPGEGQFHLVGAVLYHEAVLHRLSGDYAAAHQALDRAETLCDFLTRRPTNDEYHLPLILRIEEARLEIIEKNYSSALRRLDHAEEYDAAFRDCVAREAAGEPGAPPTPDVHKLPLRPMRRAEMNLLRGVALLGLGDAGAGQASPSGNPGRAAAVAMIRKALVIPERLSAELPADQREKVVSQFAAWAELAGLNNSAGSTRAESSVRVPP
ncbi:MAG TPA: tetratricopeptide repeat protein [Phycisphaerae bacterium]|nr:tetratricopeptide repeat protein [Phycisphaerae bacterium]